jgi:hypothetical protein
MTTLQLEPAVAGIAEPPSIQEATTPPAVIEPIGVDAETPTRSIAAALTGQPHVLQVIESYVDGKCVVVVVMTRDLRADVEPVYRAEMRAATAFPRSRFVVRVIKSATELDPGSVPGATTSLTPIAT